MAKLIQIHVAVVVAASIVCFSILLLIVIWSLCHHRHQKKDHRNNGEIAPNSLTTMESQEETARKSRNFYLLHKRGKRELFSWVDHPYLAADAVENGWSRFAFTSYKNEAEISWEVYEGSNELMQKIRLNPGLEKKVFHPNKTSMSVTSIIRTCLPLPGPFLGNHAFPLEAYFEITILNSCGGNHHESVGRREGEKTKLVIQDATTSNGKGGDLKSVEEMKVDRKEGWKSGSVMFSIGLTAGASVPLKVPGTYPKSIGFNSNGSVFLDGTKLAPESDEAQWVGTDTVIGCGFDPRKKKVFFTLNSELVHVIYCQSEEFGTPLCPTLAANIDIVILVNFGQIAFKYAPANAQRTPNPCFIAPLVRSPAATLGFDDSKELFSMGRIDSQWRNRSAMKENRENGAINFDEESTELFEIVLDGSEKSPYRMI